jgi:hypothetical protein
MFLLYETSSGKILKTYSWRPELPDSAGSLVELPDSDFDITISKYDATSNSIQLRDDAHQIQQTQRLNNVRRYRNQKLARSDWTQLPDNKLTEQQQQQWQTYRQQLRDITANLPEILPEKANGLSWPQPPQQ